MELYSNAEIPSKEEQTAAMASYKMLLATLKKMRSSMLEIEIEETSEKIKVPLSTLKLLTKILKVTGQGKPISIVPIATEMTTQTAAELLGCSRPHLVKLLEEGEIPFFKIGKHRRVKFEDIVLYKESAKLNREHLKVDTVKSDEESELYCD